MTTAAQVDAVVLRVNFDGVLAASFSDPTGWTDPEGNTPAAMVGSLGDAFALMTTTDASVVGQVDYDGSGGAAGIVAPGSIAYP